MITYAEALRALKDYQRTLLKIPQVVSIKVVREKDRNGQETENYCLRVGLNNKPTHLPYESPPLDTIPDIVQINDACQERKWVRIQTEDVGEIRPLTTPVPSLPFELYCWMTGASVKDPSLVQRCRPTPCGYSIGHPQVSGGTMGLVIQYADGPDRDNAYILSNNHVMANNNRASVGDPILQPGKSDANSSDQGTIAHLHRFVPLLAGDQTNEVDAAMAEILGKSRWEEHVNPYVCHIGYPEETLADAQIDMLVEKTGRTSGYTKGKVTETGVTIKTEYENLGYVTFENQICTTYMSEGGDSGACLFEIETKKPVGLLFAANENKTESYFNPMKSVLSALSRAHTYQNGSGSPLRFDASPYPIKIFRRSFATRSIPPWTAPNVALVNIALKHAQRVPSVPMKSVLLGVGMYNVLSSLWGPSL